MPCTEGHMRMLGATEDNERYAMTYCEVNVPLPTPLCCFGAVFLYPLSA